MKKLTIAILMIAGSGLAQADYKLVNADGTELSNICMAAATTPRENMIKIAVKAGIPATELASLRCNNLPLNRFIAKYGSASNESVAYVLKGTDESETTALCIAAASSEVEFTKVKSMYFSKTTKVEEEVRCNGLPLNSFARKYGNSGLTISLR